MATLGIEQHRIDRLRRPLPFPPHPLHPAGQIGAIGALQHQPFDGRLARRSEDQSLQQRRKGGYRHGTTLWPLARSPTSSAAVSLSSSSPRPTK